jgi:hypothetical protein
LEKGHAGRSLQPDLAALISHGPRRCVRRYALPGKAGLTCPLAGGSSSSESGSWESFKKVCWALNDHAGRAIRGSCPRPVRHMPRACRRQSRNVRIERRRPLRRPTGRRSSGARRLRSGGRATQVIRDAIGWYLCDGGGRRLRAL